MDRSHPGASRSPKSSGSPSPVGHHSFPYDRFVQQAVCQLIQCQKDAAGTSYLFLLRQMRFVSVHRTPCVFCTPCVFQKSYAHLLLMHHPGECYETSALTYLWGFSPYTVFRNVLKLMNSNYLSFCMSAQLRHLKTKYWGRCLGLGKTK